jgi:hypothetical protein
MGDGANTLERGATGWKDFVINCGHNPENRGLVTSSSLSRGLYAPIDISSFPPPLSLVRVLPIYSYIYLCGNTLVFLKALLEAPKK